MRIAAAQIGSIRGDLCGNARRHLLAIEAAAKHGVSTLLFPELSLIGYEPELAAAMALRADDVRLSPIGKLAVQHRMQVIVGAPLVSGSERPYLGALIFDRDGPCRVYAKMHLGGSEPDFFTPGDTTLTIESGAERIGLSICADSSTPTHPAAYAAQGASIYAASVFLNRQWYASDAPRFAAHAAAFHMMVLMANHADSVGTLSSVGNSAAWAPDGSLLARIEGTETGLVVASRSGDNWAGEVLPLPSPLFD